MTPTDLNARYGIADQLKFTEGPGGLVFAEIDNDLGHARVCLQGAHVTTFRPRDQAEPVVWLSERARFAPGKSIRGGAPVCWPWFGPHATEKDFPGHGFARTVMWQVIASTAPDDGETQLTLMLMPNEQTRAQWPHATRLELAISVGRSLRLALTTTNLDTEPVTITEALHTYFHIGDIGEIRVTGLEDTVYVDKVAGSTRHTQAGPVTFSGEVDRVYVDTEATCEIVDPRLGRRIVVAKSGSRSTVVWTPWAEKAEKMGDFGADGWRRMVCVESANALENAVTIPAGDSHCLSVTYGTAPL